MKIKKILAMVLMTTMLSSTFVCTSIADEISDNYADGINESTDGSDAGIYGDESAGFDSFEGAPEAGYEDDYGLGVVSDNTVSGDSLSADSVSGDEVFDEAVSDNHVEVIVSDDEVDSYGAGNYSISYVLNDSSVSRADNSANIVNTNGSRYELKSPKRKGYQFDGWYSNSGCSKRIKEIPSTNISRSITVYAKWSPVKYKIKYKLKNANNSKKNKKQYTIESDFKLKKPTLKSKYKKLYVFDGWYTDKNYNNKITSISPGRSGNLTLYAKIRKKSYKIQFVVDGKVVDTRSVALEDSYTLPGKDSYKKLGCELAQWNTSKDGKGKKYSLGSSVKKLANKDGAVIKLYGVFSVSNEYKNAYEVANVINTERAAQGLPGISTNDKLMQCAMIRAKEIANRFSHVRPNGTYCYSVLPENGYNYRSTGENIAYGQKSVSRVMECWMKSAGHRDNILSSKYKEVGIGYYEKDGVKYWVQIFASPAGY